MIAENKHVNKVLYNRVPEHKETIHRQLLERLGVTEATFTVEDVKGGCCTEYLKVTATTNETKLPRKSVKPNL